ncbi:MAG: orotidine-5'-phosphate decarboxylase [Ignavibacteria bacterium]
MTSQEKLLGKTLKNKHIAVGLDPDLSKIPGFLHSEDNPILQFNKIIIDCTEKYAASYKLNFAFYEKYGIEGMETLFQTIEYIPEDMLVIADAKRGDIGNTSQMYAASVFDYFRADAVTLHAYMGEDSIAPFLNYHDKISYILALTSNKGSNDFEKLKMDDGSYLYQKVIKKTLEWNQFNNCGIVFGATNETELEENIGSFGSLNVLLPGIGAQGGNLERVVNAFKLVDKDNFLINVSRSLLYKDNSREFARASRNEIISLNEEIERILNP